VESTEPETPLDALGIACGLGALLSACAALPAAGRLAGSGAPFGATWLALSGSTALVLGPLLFLAGRVATDASRVRAALIGAATAVLPLALLGSGLKLETNHRPLGAATFAVLALAAVLGAMLVAGRIEEAAERDKEGAAAKLRMGALGVSVLSVGVAAFQVLRNSELRPHALDGLSLMAAAALGVLLGRRLLGRKVARRASFRHAVPLWVVVVVSGLVARGVHAEVITRSAPVLGGPLAWL
jgi:hypothetical protein